MVQQPPKSTHTQGFRAALTWTAWLHLAFEPSTSSAAQAPREPLSPPHHFLRGWRMPDAEP